MTGVFLKVLELSLVGSYVMVFVLAVRLLLHICKAPRWSSYLLWGIVFLRLMLPVVPESRFGLVPTGVQLSQGIMAEVQGQKDMVSQGAEGMWENASIEMAEQQVVPGVDEISSTISNTSVNPSQSASESQGAVFTPNDTVQPVEIPKTSNEANKSLDGNVILQILTYLWLAGVIGIGGYHVVSYYKFKASLKDVVLVEDGIYEIPGKHVSFVLGIVKPAIYISESLDAVTCKVVLCHEKIHLQRKDYLTKPLALAVACVHWFNPLVWLAFYLMNKDCEMSCDEKVVSLLGEESKKLYSYALLDEAAKGEHQKCKRENMCAVLSFGEDSIKARIKHVLHFKKAPVWLIAGAIVIVVLLAIGLLSNRKSADYWGSISMGCSAKEFVRTEEGAFLTLVIFERNYNERELVIEVTDKELQEKLVTAEPSDIIGAHMFLNVPEDVLEERHIDRKAVNGFYFLEDSYYDRYLTLGDVSLGSENTVPVERLDEISGDITEYQKIPEETLKTWAQAFSYKDFNSLYALSYDKEHFTTWDMVSVLEGGNSFGGDSPWPTKGDFEIEYEEGAEEATIRYWMRSSVPEVYPVEERVKLVKDGDLYYVEHLEMVSHYSMDTLAELKEAYVRAKDDINNNLERMGNMDCRWYDWTDNTGYDKEFMQSIFYHVANNTNPKYYDAYKDPVSAAKIMLHLGAGTGEVTEILHQTESQKTRREDTHGVLGEGTVVNVMYVFAEDGSSVQIPMVLAEESLGIWALSAGDMTKEHKYTRGALMADAQFLAREVLDEIEIEEGITYQISDYGIYKVSAESFQCVYLQDMSKVLYEVAYDNGERYLYYPINSQYQEGAFNTTFDSLCKVKLSTGEVCEVYSFPFEAAGRLASEKGYFDVYGGFVTLYNVPGGNNTYVLTDAGKVWNGKTTAELTEEEKNAYGVSNREYLLSHPGEVVALGNRYASQTEAFIDMDGDGKTELIALGKGETIGQYWKYDSYVLKLDDWKEQRYSNRLHNQIWAISPDGVRIFLVIYEEGPSADDLITFLKKEEGKLIEAGSIGIAIHRLEMEDGIITAEKGVELIQTDFVTTQYAFDEQGNLVEIPQEAYDYAYYRTEEGNRLLKEMTLYTEPGGEESFTLQPQNVFFEKVDGSMKWILLRAKNGQTGWFEVTGLYEIYGSPSSEWFEGLGFAG